MNRQELLAWSAGVIEGCGVIACSIEQGPIRMYHAIDLLVPVSDSAQIRRLTIAAGNGSVSREPLGFALGGPAAIRGFLEELWPYLSAGKKKEFNAELRRFKYLKSQGLTRDN
jgi:hypothetical protein